MSSEPCFMSRADRDVLAPVLRVTKKLYIVDRPDGFHVTVSDRPGDGRNQFRSTVRENTVLSGPDLCVFCPEQDGYSDACRTCCFKQKTVTDDAVCSIAEYIAQNDLRMDHPASVYRLTDFFGTDDYLDKPCIPAAVAILKALDHAQAIARDPAVKTYDVGQRYWTNSLPHLLKTIQNPELDMKTLSLYVDILVGRYVHTLASDRSFRK